MNVSVKKTLALVCALEKLHNFCIDTESDMDVPMPMSEKLRWVVASLLCQHRVPNQAVM
jgi:hypothetical protein